MTQTIKTRKSKVVQEPVTILLRYFVKATKQVCCQVAGSTGKTYRVVLENDGRANCECDGYTKGHRACKHIRAVQIVEDNRVEKSVIVAPQQETVQPVAKPVVVALQPVDKYANIPLHRKAFSMPLSYKQMEEARQTREKGAA